MKKNNTATRDISRHLTGPVSLKTRTLSHTISANIYLFKVTIETLEKSVKCVQS